MTLPCIVEDCTTPSVSWKMCQKHYKRTKNNGSPHISGRKTLSERFFEKVDRSGECWEWLGGKNHKGYGHFYQAGEGRTHSAHRASYEMEYGTIPPRMEVDHTCRNRGCVNPEHLRLATRKQNMENLAQAEARTESGVRGVTRTSRGNWCARVGHNNRLIHIGVYPTAEEAAAAVVAKRLELHTYNHEDRIAA